MSLCTTIPLAAGSYPESLKGFEMSPLESMMPFESRIDAEARSIDPARAAASRQARDIREIAPGTPEHAVLVEAMRREFPEVYGLSSKCASVRKP
jgi:hypothetical protein